jgi:hypothetical protein
MTNTTTPAADLAGDDPTAEALRAGAAVEISYPGRGYQTHVRALGEGDALRVYRAMFPTAQPAAPTVAEPDALDAFNKNGLVWAVSRWQAAVSQRPLVNVNRRALDDTWREVVRFFGGDPAKLLGPSHDELRARLTTAEWASLKGAVEPVQAQAEAVLNVSDASSREIDLALAAMADLKPLVEYGVPGTYDTVQGRRKTALMRAEGALLFLRREIDRARALASASKESGNG